MIGEDKQKKAEEIKGIRKQGQELSERHPYVEVAEIYEKIMNIISDDQTEIFSQLFMGKLSNLYVDETKAFAIAVDFAENPLPDIEMELTRRGITRKIKTRTEKDVTTGKETEIFENQPIRFTVPPLLTFAHQWLVKRHPVNRKRVDELIRLASALRMGEQRTPIPQVGGEMPNRPPGRI